MIKKHGLSDQVRCVARKKYVEAARRAGKPEFSIKVRDVLNELVPLGFPVGNTPQVCNALQSQKFTQENNLVIVGVDGPPSKISTTVVVQYRFAAKVSGAQVASKYAGSRSAASHEETNYKETNKVRAKRLTDRLRGLLKEELAEYGGGEAFLKWIRSEDEEAA